MSVDEQFAEAEKAADPKPYTRTIKGQKFTFRPLNLAGPKAFRAAAALQKQAEADEASLDLILSLYDFLTALLPVNQREAFEDLDVDPETASDILRAYQERQGPKALK